MGNAVGKAVSLMVRPLRNFNVESRAQKVIGMDKPVAAPKHKNTEVDYDRLMKEHPDVYEASLKKHQQLDTFLKDVYVESHHSNVSPKSRSHQPLPLDRHPIGEFEYGIKEPNKIPLGRVTLKQALQFITANQTSPKEHSVQQISKEYNVDETILSNVLKHFRIYEIYIPETRNVKARFVGPRVPRMKIITHPKHQLESSEEASGEPDRKSK